ncbi:MULTISPECIES: iron-siderophore ABC transporter substrate-binding protein [unclassified Streptomyces]|uniref:iron-siderophore ABC transporter substrate-binding protein n=1 Tax=unclassified Streptomyces TaxID=2593676 RepID=UPI000DD8D72F|nr:MULTISPECIES: iron-siderophore ABC transporter substrate-binding protein [unclassified Streptomyces]QZZ29852.1 iron-siderophore ABC transporter substrate-binding protein [Streptomyces sp. ST1015]
MRTSKPTAILTAALIAGTVLAGCSTDSDGATKDAKAPGGVNKVAGASEGPAAAPGALAAGMGSDVAKDGTFPRTVKHYAGTTTVTTAPTKIAVLSTGQLDDLLSLGVVPTASTRAANAGLVPDYLSATFPQYKTELNEMSDAGTRQAPNLESLATAKPDLILVNKSLSDLYPKLSKIAPTVVTAGQGINWKRDLLLVGDAVGKGQAARTLLNGIVADAKSQGAGVKGDPTVSMVRFTPDRTRMFGVSSFTGSIAVDMGLARPASQQFKAISQDISSEKIDTADGDWIFYSVQGDASKTDAASTVAGPLWKGMKGVKAGHAVQVDDDPWYLNAGPTAARLVVGELAEHLAK